ncbi:hypothetical protein [Streptomyces genisteinicus]|uniref:Uncharacterized protein n=1 Tax=Streptomyces genisteinicus TaxID=2768068 RepID=A0A7H0HMV7_9ACTN|nr:hypothetical protein [Streptomyces genisteinicus]QNP61873.1 hypothetical protein IAG43_02330 [Streptomyces genisteinicus]
MSVSAFQALPATARPLTEEDPGHLAMGTAPVTATPMVLATAFAAGLAVGVTLCDSIGETGPIQA